MDEFGLPSPLLPDSSFVLLPPNASSANSSSLLLRHGEGGGGDDLLTEHYVNLGIYAAIVVGLMVTSLVRTVHFFVLCMRSSVRLHNAMFWRIIHAPCRFFDTNPVGKKKTTLERDDRENTLDSFILKEIFSRQFFKIISR